MKRRYGMLVTSIIRSVAPILAAPGLTGSPVTSIIGTSMLTMPRRSPRLQALHSHAAENPSPSDPSPSTTTTVPDVGDDSSPPIKKRKRATRKPPQEESNFNSSSKNCLPRTVEQSILTKFPHVQYVIGIDEAGRGPLAGPVVAAAVWAPQDVDGIVDSKKITSESERERLWETLQAMPSIQWAVAIMDAQRIDEINILQATLQGMRMAAMALVSPTSLDLLPVQSQPSMEHTGSYVVYSSTATTPTTSKNGSNHSDLSDELPCPKYYALIDGNKVPKDMPCPAEAMVKGDGKEFCIAAASILAKVTRDRLMHQYDTLYPQFDFKQHKGYPTAQHMQAVAKYGASPIHRRTFAPLKHMTFDDQTGQVLSINNNNNDTKKKKKN